jgi:hypothetical protein
MSQQYECQNCASSDVPFVEELGQCLCKLCEQMIEARPPITPK